MAFEPEVLALGHTRALFEVDTIREALTAYRDAIRHVVDTTRNGIDAGLTIDELDYATSCLDFFNHEFVIAATDLRCGTRCPLDDGDPLTNEVGSLGVGWLGCPVRVGYPDADRSASGTV